MKAAEILGEDMVALISEDSSDEELETRGQGMLRGYRYIYKEDKGTVVEIHPMYVRDNGSNFLGQLK
jgi:hypothetical protein